MFESKSPDVKICCEDCGRLLHKHGRYWRGFATKKEVTRIPVYRQYCPVCRITISILPDFLVPWARYTTWVRESAMTRKHKGFSWRQTAESTTTPPVRYSRRTLKRWWARHLQRVADAALWLAGQFVAEGVDDDLLRLYPTMINPTPLDTLDWMNKLLSRYLFAGAWRRGYWPLLNSRLPAESRL
jgi:Domain of unknown function (DUF6431)